MLKIENVDVKRSGVQILHAVNAELSRGQIVGLIGANGAGKSTLINAIATTLPFSGSITWNEKPIQMKDLGFMPQHAQVRADLTVLEAVLLGLHENLGFKIADELIQRAISALETFKVAHLHARKMQALSGGQQQLVLLAQKLIRRPELLLLDEATSALDICHQMRVFERLQEYVEETGALVISAIHELNIAARFSQQTLLMSQGRIFAAGKFLDAVTEKNIEDVYGIHVEICHTPRGNVAVIPICPCR